LGKAFEEKIHDSIQSAATKRSQARSKLVSANQALYKAMQLTPSEKLGDSLEFSSFKVKSNSLSRLDAHFYSPAGIQASLELSNCSKTTRRLDEVARVFTPGIFKRIHVSDPRYGYPYFSGSELFELVPEPRGFLSKKSANIDDYVVRKDWLLIQDAGQLGGLIGQITRVRPGADGSVVSNHLMRVVCVDPSDNPYVFLVLKSRHGHLAILRHAFGTSIPQLDPVQVRTGISIPWLDSADRKRLGVEVSDAWQLTDEADLIEADAISKVEAVIAEGV
jgi:type I restriction enzyme S subunit